MAGAVFNWMDDSGTKSYVHMDPYPEPDHEAGVLYSWSPTDPPASPGGRQALFSTIFYALERFADSSGGDQLTPLARRTAGLLRAMLEMPGTLTKGEALTFVELLSALHGAPPGTSSETRCLLRINTFMYCLIDRPLKFSDDLSDEAEASLNTLHIEAERVLTLDRLDARNLQAQDALERIKDVEQHAREAAGVVAGSSLAAHYMDQADLEVSIAGRFRISAIVLVLASAVIGALIGKNATTGEIVRHAAWALSALLLSGYLARESGQHRFVAREFRFQQVRLQSLEAYAEGISDAAVRAEFLERVGTSVFTAPIPHPGRDASDSAEALNILDRMSTLAKSVGSGKSGA